MWTYIAIAVAAGLTSSLLSFAPAIGAIGGLMLGQLAPLPLFLSGLAMGPHAAAIAGGVGTAAGILFGNLTLGLNFLALSAVPVTLVTRQALLWRELPDGTTAWYPLGRLALVLPALATLYFLSLLVIFEFTGTGLITWIEKDILSPIAAAFYTVDDTGVLLSLAPVVPAAMAVTWMLLLIANGALAQGLLKRFERNRRPEADIARLRLPIALLPLFVVAILLASASGQLGMIGKTLAAIGSVPYFLAGLAAIHGWVRPWRARPIFLVILYCVIPIVFWLCILIVGVGLWQQVTGLRQGKRGTGNGQEDQ